MAIAMKDTADVFLLDTAGTELDDTTVSTAEARISQEAVEVILAGQPDARIAQEAIEVILAGQPDARISQLVIEVVVKQSHTYKLALSIN